MRYEVGNLCRELRQRFEKFVLWTATKDRRGYGKFAVLGTPRAAHQVSWVIYRGYLPEGMFVLHRCDNPPCVNPAHLFLGTHTDNMRDMHSKGRADNRRGENSALTHFTEAQVLEIYARAWAGERATDLAKEFGVRATTISCIKHGDNWNYLTKHKVEHSVQFHAPEDKAA